MNILREEYQQNFADLVHAQYARAFCLGRQALAVLFKAVGIKAGDKVGICSFTCLAVVESVKVCGGIPVFLDTDEGLCIDPASILRQESIGLKVVVLQHTFGNPGRLDELLSACNKVGAIIIEDCAHALGSCWDGIPVGSFSVGAIYSFQWGKPVTTGQGGMLTVNTNDMREKVDDVIKSYGRRMRFKNSLLLRSERLVFDMLHPRDYDLWLRNFLKKIKQAVPDSDKELPDWKFERGYLVLPDSSTSRAGLKNVRTWQKVLREKKESMRLISENVVAGGLRNIWISPRANVCFQRYPFIVNNKEEIIAASVKNNLDIAGWYNTPAHPLAGEQLRAVGYEAGCCPHTEELFRKLVHVPVNGNLVRRFKKYLSVLSMMR